MINDKNVIIKAAGLRKSYGALDVLKGLDLEIFKGEAICIMGSSGAGKSTLLHLLGALDRPSSGEIYFEGKNIAKLSDDQLSHLRNNKIGFVFQFHHLLDEFSALENVMMPLLLKGESFNSAKAKADVLLTELGLKNRSEHRPAQMSGGENQRVAIARALICEPAVIFADEPTGNLDQKNGLQVQTLLFDLQRKRGLTLVTVTHDYEFSRRFPKVRTLRDGQWY